MYYVDLRPMISMKIFRIAFSCLFMAVVCLACKNGKSNDNKAKAIISKSIELSGGNRLQNAVVSFQFRNKIFKVFL